MKVHVYECPIRWSDMDAFGHVNNVVYFRYFEESRIDIAFRLAPQESEHPLADGSVVTKQEIEYRTPIVYHGRPVTVETYVSRLTSVSVTFEHEIKDEGQTHARGCSVMVACDVKTGRPRRLSSVEKEFFTLYLRSSD